MDTALLQTRLLLAVVFVVAGAAKLADREGSRQAAAEFGVPTPLATPLAVLLPLAELAVAAALVPAATAWWGAAALALAPALLRCGYRRQPGPRPQAGLPLLRAAALGNPAGLKD